MNANGIGNRLTNSYPSLATKKESQSNQVSLLNSEPESKSKTSHKNNQAAYSKTRIATHQILKINETQGFIHKAKDNIIKLDKEIDTTIQKVKSKKQDFSKLEKTITSITSNTYNGEEIFNQRITIALDNSKISIDTQIKKPPIENIDDIYQLKLQTKEILEQINQIESEIESRVDKEIDSMDYSEIKEKNEFKQKILDDTAHTAQVFQDISESESIQKELLWLLR